MDKLYEDKEIAAEKNIPTGKSSTQGHLKGPWRQNKALFQVEQFERTTVWELSKLYSCRNRA